MAERFAGEGRLVDVERHGLYQLAVSGHLVAGVEDDDVIHHDILAGYLHRVAVSDDLHRLVVVDLVEDGKFFLGLVFKEKRQARGQDDGDEYPYRLEKDSESFAEPVILVE